ncbi:hypothetical protein SAMN04487896_1858 [Paenibacillus sp. ov031]|uniref:hypothetical protein n=1 Tax=unclassified Paenibacillus TaxID=185978 RepID=UPI00088D1974|nr:MULTISPECIES: hypothetical protein [unclassified Paenibacillus]SDK60093.1 hypothetical protein SAMN05428961_102565 [Paenibacillus sp. OK060]SHN62601.1 hypothetical protein SAMN04487896_1858 [Paenibacillus sp. ov031]
MTVKIALLLVLGICAGGLIITLLVLNLLRHRGGDNASKSIGIATLNGTRTLRWGSVLLQSYRWGMKVPLFSAYILQVQKRISFRHVGDEPALRRMTMNVVLIIFGGYGSISVILFLMQPGIAFVILSVLCAVVLNSLVLDMCLNRMEKRLLVQMLDLFADVRHRYHQHGMVEEALYEAAEAGKGEAAEQVLLIYEALTSPDPNEALERYYEIAPNRFLKGFAGISYMVMEFGDKDRAQGSIYLKGLGNLTQEIHLEILRRDKLDYLLKGLNIIALAPVLFTAPIERWARGSFPTMDEFYRSKIGFVTKISIYVIIILAYLLLQRLQQYDETRYRTGRKHSRIDQFLYRQTFIRKVAMLFVAKPGSTNYSQTVRLMRESSSELKYEWLAIRRLMLFVSCFVLTIGCVFLLHQVERNHILHDPVRDDRMFGAMGEAELKQATEKTSLDQAVLERIEMKRGATFDEISNALQSVNPVPLEHDAQTETIARILQKLEGYNKQYLHWWELIIAMMIGLAGYHMPIWLMMFQRKMRSMDMRHEIYQFQTVISILREMDRMSVEEILEWLNRFAVIFKRPLQKCLLHFEHGPEHALEQLKEDAGLPEFQRLVEKLQLALGKISIREAFDDLDSMMAFYFEQRKQEYTKMIDVKASWGRMIGFTPMYALIFLYLVIPLVGMSFLQMNIYYEQIQKL